MNLTDKIEQTRQAMQQRAQKIAMEDVIYRELAGRLKTLNELLIETEGIKTEEITEDE